MVNCKLVLVENVVTARGEEMKIRRNRFGGEGDRVKKCAWIEEFCRGFSKNWILTSCVTLFSDRGVKNLLWTIQPTIRSTTTRRSSTTQKWNSARRPRRRLSRTETWPVRRTKVRRICKSAGEPIANYHCKTPGKNGS